MWLAYVLHLLIMTAATGATMVVGLYAAHLGAGGRVLGALLSISALMPLLLGFVAGRIVDRFGVRLPMLAGSFMIACASLSAAVVPGLAMQFGAVILLGAGYSFCMVSQQNMVGVLSTPGKRARSFANLSLVYSLGGFLGPLLASELVEQRGYPVAFNVLGLLPLAAGLLLMTRLAFRICRSRPHPLDPQKPVFLADLLLHRPLLYVVAAGSLALACADLFQFYGPMRIQTAGLAPGDVSAVMSAYAAAALATRIFMPQLIALARGEERLLMVCLIVAMAACAMFPLAGGLWMLVLLGFALGMGLGCAQPLSMMMTYAAAPPGRSGEGLGLRLMAGNGARLVLPLVLGPLGAIAGLTVVFWATVGLLFVGMMCTRRLSNGRPASGPTHPVGAAPERPSGGA